jgi:predicted transcriptional regulator
MKRMPKEISKDSDSTIVIMGGKKTTIAEVKKSYANLEFLSKASAVDVVNILLNGKEPLNREQIAKQANLSLGYTIEVLNNLIKYDYVAQFRIGKRKLIYYALTEKGYDVLVSKGKKTE